MRNDPSLPSGASLRGCMEAYMYEQMEKEVNEDA